jgi:hypothetical protein
VAVLAGIVSAQFLGHQNDGQIVSNTIHLQHGGTSGVPDLPTMAALASDLDAYLGATYRGIGNVDYVQDSVVVKNVSDKVSKDILGEQVHPVNLPGTRPKAGTGLPNAVCGLLALKSFAASRNFRGHLFMHPCISSSAVNYKQLSQTDAYWTALGAFAGKLDDGCANPTPTWTGSELHNWGLVIFSQKRATAGDPFAAACVSVVVRQSVHFLRSRDRGGS